MGKLAKLILPSTFRSPGEQFGYSEHRCKRLSVMTEELDHPARCSFYVRALPLRYGLRLGHHRYRLSSATPLLLLLCKPIYNGRL